MCLFLFAVNPEKIEDGSIDPLETTRKNIHSIYQEVMTLCVLKSLTSEAIPSATQFFKRAYKIFPDYKHPGLICLALPPRQKFGLILVIKWLKN